jgi:hypothetical protein
MVLCRTVTAELAKKYNHEVPFAMASDGQDRLEDLAVAQIGGNSMQEFRIA